MYWAAVVGVLLSMSMLTDAWWFINRQKTLIHPQTDIEERCVQAARNGSCDFYQCLENRYPCRDHSFAINHGLFYCQRFQQHLHSFNQMGQQWVESSQKCITRRLLEKYNMPSGTCHNLNKVDWEDMSKCYLREGFCSMALENREALWRVFRVTDLTHSFRAWRALIEVARECSGYSLNRFIQWALQKVVGSYRIHG